MLAPLASELELFRASSGAEALLELDRSACDIIVTDLAMPGMNGGELLAEVRARHPCIVRMLLCDGEERELARKAAPEAHQQIAKHCPPELFRTTIRRSAALHDALNNERLMTLVARMDTLPCMPANYHELVTAMRVPDVTVANLGAIIARDIGMTATVLQIVNSAVFSLREKITSPGQAAAFLGLDTLRSLVLSVGVFTQFQETDLELFSLDELGQHSLRVAHFTRAILETEHATPNALEEGFLAGMMHDSGKLVLAVNRTERYRAMRFLSDRDGLDPIELERRLFGVSHAAVGAYPLSQWGLAQNVVEAVCFHHTPSLSHETDFDTLCAVHVANCIAGSNLDDESAGLPGLDLSYLKLLGLERRLPRWRQACRDAEQVAHTAG